MSGTTWFLVADVARARLYREKDQVFEEVADYVHPVGGQRTGVMISDAAGRRGMGAAGDGSRPGLSPATPKDTEAARFAKELAARLREGLLSHRYQTLVLVAPPRFLGQLRAALDPQVERRVAAAYPKDFLELPGRALIARLEAMLQPRA